MARKTCKKANPSLNQQLTVSTAHTCVHITVNCCSTQLHSTEQFWQSATLSSWQSSLLRCWPAVGNVNKAISDRNFASSPLAVANALVHCLQALWMQTMHNAFKCPWWMSAFAATRGDKSAGRQKLELHCVLKKFENPLRFDKRTVILKVGNFSRERGTAAPVFSAHVYCGHGRPCQLLLSSCTVLGVKWHIHDINKGKSSSSS